MKKSDQPEKNLTAESTKSPSGPKAKKASEKIKAAVKNGPASKSSAKSVKKASKKSLAQTKTSKPRAKSSKSETTDQASTTIPREEPVALREKPTTKLRKTSKAQVKKVETIRIRYVRSAIGRPGRQKQVVLGLGLRKLNQVVERPDTKAVRGMVAKIPHLVQVVEGEER